jgi:ketosteroid isomerase-like protein
VLSDQKSFHPVALCMAGTLSGQAQSAGSRDEASIKAQLTAYAEASQWGDGHARALFCTEDAEVWLSTTRALSRGRAALEPIGHAFYVMLKQDTKWLIRATRTARFMPAPS